MTVEEAKKKLIDIASAELGYREGSNNYTKYAEGLKAYYGFNLQNQPWCDIFVDWCFVQAFGMLASEVTYQPMGKFSAACSVSANYYSEHGALKKTPEIGDQVFFTVNGGINHTGIVVAVSGDTVTTIEGNSSDSVRRNAYVVNSSRIAGYGRPNWSAVADIDEGQAVVIEHPDKNSKFCTVTMTLPVLMYSDVGWRVKVMQSALIGQGYSCGWMGADGEYGEKTKSALTAFQKSRGLSPDGICGERTWSALLGGS